MKIDYSASAEFLRNFFGPTTEHAVELRCLPQESGSDLPKRPLYTRDTDLVSDHLKKWDQPDRACYFGACTRITGKGRGSRADCAELSALWVDIDCEKQSFSKADAVSAALSLPLRPSLLIDSGGGIHGYWLLREALDVRVERPLGPHLTTPDDDAIVAVLRQLAGVLAGDPAVCDIARVMRLPGTFNHKYGSPRLCSLLPVSDFSIRYEFSDLVDMLYRQRPMLRSKGAPPAVLPAENDPYIESARLSGWKPPTDVEARLAAMQFEAIGDAGVHQTQLDVGNALAARGYPIDEIVNTLMLATERAAGVAGSYWNWKREEKEIRLIAETAPAFTNATQQVRSRTPLMRLVGGSAVAVAAPVPDEVEDEQPDVVTTEKIRIKIAQVVAKFNTLYMVVNEEGRAMVYQPWHDERIGRWIYRRITFDDLRKFYLNVPIYIGDTKPSKGEPKKIYKTAAEVWLVNSERKQYLGGITFDPAGSVPPSVLNLWRGFAVAPVAGSWSLMQDHIRQVICRDDEVCYRFLMGWMARLVQQPACQGEVAVVLKSESHGAGKGTLARALMKILGQHAMAISSSRLLTGTFNGHLRDCVFLFADEAFWAGDKQGLGTLKSLITEPYLAIEAKNQTPVQTANFIHLMMASNEDWVVPAALTDRRFFVLNILDSRAQDHAYFKAIQDQMDGGGYGAMLFDLLAYDLSSYNPRAIPQTAGLEDQRTQSLPVPEEWWQTVLHRGYVWESKLGLEETFAEWMPIVSTELLYASYLEFAKGRRSYHPMVRVHFGRFMHRMGAGGGKRSRLTVGERVTKVPNNFGGTTREPRVYERNARMGYSLGTLDQARVEFEKATRLHVDWGDEEVTLC